MAQIKQILCPVDFFPASRKAAEYAIGLAKAFRARLILLHVVEPAAAPPFEVPVNVTDVINAMTRSAAEMLDGIAKRAGAANVAVDRVVRTGHVASEIQRLITTRDIDCVVMGTHGRTGLGRALMGSTTKRLLRKLNIPLLTIDDIKPRSAANMRRILVTTDFSKGTQEAATFAVSMARQFNAKVTLVHVLNDLHADLAGIYREPLIRSIRDKLFDLLPKQVPKSANVTARVEVGRPNQRIRALVKNERIDLIVMNVHGKTLLDRLTVGSTAEKLIGRSGAPILWIPHKPEQAAKVARRTHARRIVV